jgi:hypothetical protein
MTPNRIAFLAAGIFGTIGILVSVVIIAINGGFSGSGPSIFNPPTSKDLWTIGNNIEDGMNLTYSVVTATGEMSNLTDSIVSMKFHDLNDKWNVTFAIKNGSTVKEINMNLTKDQLLPKDPITANKQKVLSPVESSILAIRDIAREPKYLVIGAVWDKITTSSSTVDERIASKDSISTPAGPFNVYGLEYQLGNSTNRIYLDKDLPLPIKAKVYDENEKILYEYELQSISR